VNVLDLGSFLAPARRYGTQPGNPTFDQRWDLQPGRGTFGPWINIADMSAVLSGSTGLPPMTGGTKAYGSAFVCTDPPPP